MYLYFSKLLFLFASSFLAATLFPAQSELVFTALHLQDNINIYVLLFVATFGNVLGACFNWFLGKFCKKFREHKYFPFDMNKMTRYKDFYLKWGYLSLLLSCLPIIGDPLTFISGFFNIRFHLFLLLVTISKLARYILLLLIF